MKRCETTSWAYRTRFPATIYAVSGTQAEGPENNSLTVMELTDLHKTIHDDAEDSEELSEDDDHLDDDQVLDQRKVRHPGGVNRVRSMPQQPNVLASWADTGHVHVWDVGPQLASLDGPPPPGMTSTPAPLRCLTFCAQVQPTRGIVNGSQGLLHSLTFDGAIMYILKYMAKPTAGACMALAICDDGDDDMPALEA